MRLPFELGWSPSPASITPAFTSFSLKFPISVRIFSPGITPASESLLALTKTITRICNNLLLQIFGAGLPDIVDRLSIASSTYMSNERQLDRQAPSFFLTIIHRLHRFSLYKVALRSFTHCEDNNSLDFAATSSEKIAPPEAAMSIAAF